MRSPSSISYQPALDGVRALAVLAVLGFHAEVPGFSGGYLGVSVFFTLSGFLITSLLVAEHESNGRVAAGAFYARRARRLLPASLTCIAGIVVLSAVTDVFDGVSELRRDVVGSLLQVANWVFLAGEGSYQELFEQASGSVSPLEHYWSLAIEEQFYWVWPLAFAGLVAVARSRRSQIRVLGAVTAASVVAAPVIAAVWGPDAAYWATPARAAEILVGGLLALVIAGRSLPGRAAWAAPVALAALAVAGTTFPTAGGPAYHGALPLVALASGALVLGLQLDGPLRTALSARPLPGIGRISYGLYLYHWPAFVILDERRTDLDGATLVALRLAVTFAVAGVSYVVIEQPIRRGRAIAIPITLGTALGATGAVAVCAVAIIPPASSEYWRLSPEVVDAAAIEPDDAPLATLAPVGVVPGPSASAPFGGGAPPGSAPGSAAPAPTSGTATTTADPAAAGPGAGTSTTITATTAPPTSAPPTSAPPTSAPAPLVPSRPVRIVVAGDSTAEATGVGLVSWAAANPSLAQVELAAERGCGFVRGGELLVEEWTPVDRRCDEWLDETLPARTAALQPDVVVLLTTSWDVLDRRWSAGEALVPADPPYRDRIVADVAAISERLLASGAGRVVWIREPIPNVYWWGSGQAQEDPTRHAVLYAAMDAAAGSGGGRVEVVDLPGWLAATGLDTDQEARPDGVHWTPEASRRIADGFLGEQLIRIALTAPQDPAT